ncbi:hypothetical protein LIER_26781 [Lithospermum erythrorhizon]|uniref:Uncharacterized protein n=1 Tax=Lithospermum erythrorhizon TaxID=34254 RepID=A0AAV3RD07_LITER
MSKTVWKPPSITGLCGLRSSLPICQSLLVTSPVLKKITFSPALINKFYTRVDTGKVLKEVNKNVMACELTGGLLTKWPAKKRTKGCQTEQEICSVTQSGISKLAALLHSTSLTETMASLMMICGVLLNQHHNILEKSNVQGETLEELLIIEKLLKGTHVADVSFTTIITGESSKADKLKEKM